MPTIPINDAAPRISYTATGGQTVFPYPFWITDEEDLKVYQNGTLLTLTTNYTVSDVLDTDGGDVTLTTGATADDVIVIVRDIPIERLTEFSTSGQFTAAAINLELSRLIAICQQLETDSDRTLKLPDTSTISTANFSLPSTFIGGRGLKWDDVNNTFVLTENQIDSTVPQGVYLGSKAADPALDNEGNALEAGALYFNTTDDLLKVYDGSVWVQANFNPDVDIDFTGNNTHSGTETFTGNTIMQGVLDVTNVNAETSAGWSLRTNGGTNCLSGGGGGAANLTLGGNMSGASTHKLVNMADPTAAQDYATKAYVDGSGVFTENYTSSQTAIGTVMTFAHGLSAEPKLVQIYGVCIAADAGYSIGEKVLFNNGTAALSGSQGMSIIKDATNIVITVGVTSAQTIINKSDRTADAITDADWEIVVEAWV